jgi:hypothetical protein
MRRATERASFKLEFPAMSFGPCTDAIRITLYDTREPESHIVDMAYHAVTARHRFDTQKGDAHGTY